MTKKIISVLLALMLCFCLAVSVSAASWIDNADGFLFDEADLLTDAEEIKLEQTLSEISRACNAQLVICTIPSMNGGDVDLYLDYLYDTMGFGYGANHDGVLLLICMDPREYRILSNGYAGVAISYYEIEALCEIMDAYLPSGRYATAFDAFAWQCETYLDGYLNGYPFNVSRNVIISLVIGLLAGLIVTLILKGQLKSVRHQYQANSYIKQGSMQLRIKRDIFLYRNVTRRRKENNSSSGSHGGSSRSRGGGSF